MNNKTTNNYLQKFKSLGKNITKVRKIFSQNLLAEKLDISREHLAKVETAKSAAGFDLLINIALILNVKVRI